MGSNNLAHGAVALDSVVNFNNYNTDTVTSEPVNGLASEEIKYRIQRAKDKLGSRLLVLGHHYQQEEVIQFADLRGDSFLLARQAVECKDAEYIVFLGVNFMAETADIVTASSQKVIIPDPGAGCLMANMAEMPQVHQCWQEVQKRFPGELIPVTYVNSSAEVKAFCGKHGGLTCTSSSAKAAFRWAFKQGKRILFFPDKHLGCNTGVALGAGIDEMAVWNRSRGLLTGSTNPRVVLWDGYCPVHQEFGGQQIESIRNKYPGIRVVVHPECSYETVCGADECGSTEHIIKCVQDSPPGSYWAVGTEINLVKRLAAQCSDKKVFSLDDTVIPCPDMMKINMHNLLSCLEGLVDGQVENRIDVNQETAHWARLALERMLNLA